MKLEEFNKQTPAKAQDDLFRCCGCTSWVNKLMEQFPFSSIEDLKINSDKIWFSASEEDWLEAFSHHPQIGENADENKKHTSTKDWAVQEQAGTKDADAKTLSELKSANKNYREKFGFIYIVCATRKSGNEMLDLINERLKHERPQELHIAANEQNKITHLRIDKLLT